MLFIANLVKYIEVSKYTFGKDIFPVRNKALKHHGTGKNEKSEIFTTNFFGK